MQQTLDLYLAEVKARVHSTHLVVPAQRLAFKAGYSFSKEPFEQQLKIWDFIWMNSTDSWPKVHAFFYLESCIGKKEKTAKIWETALRWQEKADSWSLCDSLAKIYTKVLEAFPERVYNQLAEWNKSDVIWKRRQSAVSLLYFSRTKKMYLPFDKIATLVVNLLTDDEYYVQKGVGWALREMHSVYPLQTLKFIHNNIQNISPIAFTIAIEKMDMHEIDEIKERRKRAPKP